MKRCKEHWPAGVRVTDGRLGRRAMHTPHMKEFPCTCGASLSRDFSLDVDQEHIRLT